jgi:hypothetical protein
VTPGERWLPAAGFEGLYEVSDRGRVASLPRPNRRGRLVLTPSPDTDGYLQVVLCSAGIRHTRKVHVLVAEAFIGARPAGKVTRHLDGDQLNNARSNLRWGTHAENAQDRISHGRDFNKSKTAGSCGHALTGDNLYRDPAGHRHCRQCRSESAVRFRARRPRVPRPSGEACHVAKLSDRQVAEIRERALAGRERQVDIAAEFAVCQATVSQIKRGASRA